MASQPMPEPYHGRGPEDVSDIDTARLALRGAVESLRSLQEVNQRLKGEIQEYANRNKLLDQRMIAIQTDLNVANAKLARQDEIFERKEQELRRHIRQEVTLEENGRWQAEMASLRQTIEMWKAAREQKEAELERLQSVLSRKESDILALQKEKVVVQGKANQEMATSLAKSRADLKQAVETVIQEKDKQLEKVQTELSESIQDLETRLRGKEQEAHARDENIAQHFHERQKELSAFWAKREQEIWERAEQAKETLEAGLKERWEKRLEELTHDFAQKTYLIEQNFANRQAELAQKEHDLENQVQAKAVELGENFTKKTTALEQAYIERTAALEIRWSTQEKELSKAHRKALDTEREKFNEELRKAKEETSAWVVGRDADFHVKQAELRQRHQTLEKDLREAWGKREEELTLRHAEEIKKAQETLSQTLHDKLTVAAEDYRKHLDALQTHLADVDKKRLDQESELKSLMARVAFVDRERTQLAETLQAREAAFQKLTEEKEKTWNATNEALQQQSLQTAQEAFEKNEAQKLRIADLEKQNADLKTQLPVQQDRIQHLEKERQTIADTLQAREAALLQQLDLKEREWSVAHAALREQFSNLTTESTRRSVKPL